MCFAPEPRKKYIFQLKQEASTPTSLIGNSIPLDTFNKLLPVDVKEKYQIEMLIGTMKH